MKIKMYSILMLFVCLMTNQTMGQNYKLPFLPNEIWRCDQGNADDPGNTSQDPNITHLTTNSMKFAWDFNWGAGSADLRKPYIAPRSGLVSQTGYQENFNSQGQLVGWGHYVILQFGDGKYGKAAHLSQKFVKKGEYIEQGEVIGLVGGTPNYSPHIHWQEQIDGILSGESTPSGFQEVNYAAPTSSIRQSPTPGVAVQKEDLSETVNRTYLSANTALFDDIYTTSGGQTSFGQTIEITDYGWWEPWTGGDYSNVYMTHPNQTLIGGSLYNPHIIYDPMRGAKSAVLSFGKIFGKWASISDPGYGPNSYLGAPIDQEYLWAGYTIQDFQGGYIRWNGLVAEAFPYPEWFGPGAFDPSGGLTSQHPELLLQNLPQGGGYQLITWSPVVSYLFVECFKQNGMSSNLGWPYSGAVPGASAGVHQWDFSWTSGESDFYWVQNFDDGAYGDCIIMYDPDNAGSTGFTPAGGTNKAHLIRGNIWTSYRDNNWITVLGAPVNDQHLVGTDWIQEFQLGYVIDDGSTINYFLYNPGSGNLNITSNVLGASSILVDGIEIDPTYYTPTPLFFIAAGTHTVSATLNGEQQSEQVNTAANEITRVDLTFSSDSNNPPQGDITVISPNGGEVYPNIQNQQITVTWSGSNNSVHIELSRDNGQTWQSIGSSQNVGTYTQDLPPGLDSDQCLVKVYELGNTSNFDISNSTFTIGDQNQPPDAQNFQVTTIYPNSATVDLIQHVSDPQGNNSINWNSLQILNITNGAATINGSNVYFTPKYRTSGTETIDYKVADIKGEWSNVASITMDVTEGVYAHSVAFASNSIYLGYDCNVFSGDVMVNDISTGPTLEPGFEIATYRYVTMPSDYSAKANRINLGYSTTVNSDIHYNQLTTDRYVSLNGADINTLSVPMSPVLPVLRTSSPGNQDTTVARYGFITLEPGNYQDVFVDYAGTLTLTGGEYHFKNLITDRYTKIYFDSISEVYIKDRLDVGYSTTVSPSDSSEIVAHDIIFYVEGINGTTGELSDYPKSVKTDRYVTFQANVFAPNGTVDIGYSTNIVGAIIAKDIDTDRYVRLTLDSYFSTDAQLSKQSVAQKESIVKMTEAFSLYQNYPNPFNPTTTIQFDIPQPNTVKLQIFSITGQLIETLVDGFKDQGSHRVTWDASTVPSGIYVYRMQAGAFSQTRKLILVK